MAKKFRIGLLSPSILRLLRVRRIHLEAVSSLRRLRKLAFVLKLQLQSRIGLYKRTKFMKGRSSLSRATDGIVASDL